MVVAGVMAAGVGGGRRGSVDGDVDKSRERRCCRAVSGSGRRVPRGIRRPTRWRMQVRMRWKSADRSGRPWPTMCAVGGACMSRQSSSATGPGRYSAFTLVERPGMKAGKALGASDAVGEGVVLFTAGSTMVLVNGATGTGYRLAEAAGAESAEGFRGTRAWLRCCRRWCLRRGMCRAACGMRWGRDDVCGRGGCVAGAVGGLGEECGGGDGADMRTSAARRR